MNSYELVVYRYLQMIVVWLWLFMIDSFVVQVVSSSLQQSWPSTRQARDAQSRQRVLINQRVDNCPLIYDWLIVLLRLTTNHQYFARSEDVYSLPEGMTQIMRSGESSSTNEFSMNPRRCNDKIFGSVVRDLQPCLAQVVSRIRRQGIIGNLWGHISSHQSGVANRNLDVACMRTELAAITIQGI